jgi:insertion element IS1 protein InsB
MPRMPGTWTDVSPGIQLCWPIAWGQATNRRYGDECERHSWYGAGVARESDYSSERIKKKEPAIQHVNQAVLKHLDPKHVEVEIYRADELAQRRGLTSELDEMWSFVGKKAEPRWLWHAIDHYSGTVWAYVFGRRRETVFLELQALLAPFGMTRFYTDGWGAYERHLDPEQHVVGKQYTQKIESKHINLRTRIKRLVRRTICFSKSTTMHDLVVGLFINRYEFGRCLWHENQQLWNTFVRG